MTFNQVALDHLSFSCGPFIKINSEKTEYEVFTEFKYLKNSTIRYVRGVLLVTGVIINMYNT